jgi:hypothetical protein
MRIHRLYILPLLLLCLSAATACTGTRTAYKAAETPDQMAFIVTEHYAALVKEAADLKEKGTLTGSARPLVLQLRALSDAYTGTKSAESEAALQAALNKAVLAVSNLITSLKGARS